MKKLLLFFILTSAAQLFSLSLFAQQATQTIRGVIRDEVSQTPVIGASVMLIQPEGANPIGAITDVNGAFKITGVPQGRQTFRITSVGYEEQRLSNVLLTSGKEVVVNVTMTENVQALNEVVVTADRSNDKTKTNNELSLVSGRSFNIEDTKRYAGSLGDPSRMAANYAGVVSGDDSRNDIVVRGNSPTGMLWQLEGLNIPNPNHFGSLSATGGPVSLLNNNVLAKSDFMTSAFPAQYGNALSAVFDLRMREGNNEKSEFLGQVGFNGFELGAEAPFSKKSKASYLFNYRYSTLGVFKALGINFGTGNAVPDYQDLNFKVAVPTSAKGKITLFGIIGASDVQFLGNDVDTTVTDLYGTENSNTKVRYATNILGLSYEHSLSAKTFAKLTLGISTTDQNFNGDSISTVTREAFANSEGRFKTQKYSASLNVRHKINAKNSLYGGITTDLLNFDLYNRNMYQAGKFDTVRVDVKGENSLLTQAYGQWKYRINRSVLLTTGVHFQHYSLNDKVAIEPRFGFQYAFNNGQSLSAGYGMNSQAQDIYTYFVQTKTPSGAVYTNKDLGFTRSHHLVLSYENRLTENLLLKIEPYFQTINNAPVEKRKSSFSALNIGSSFGPSDRDSLVNEGTGENVGIELTLERYFNKGYYFLITSSLFESKYKGSDKIERNTAFNTRYVLNVLAGKEIKIGRNKNNVLSASIRSTLVGGKYISPLNLEASRVRGDAVYDERKAFSLRQDPYFRTDLRFSFRKEYRRSTMEFALDLQNVTANQNVFQQTYNPRTNSLATQYQQGFFPVPLFRYTF
ncbi:TonB-dependent receptor [Dyadobacter sp. CY347]|uniref:TonB-dependent receptor n=1 Tax=Dyadobacter sp. CY347 TaxID=2909336 RepID=UPI001F42DA57|nr:TonB-dependent receptor [Dyadobacter sp. CY347]MCF2489464.1 TonB-dependent receptor [Dyadobacter sp. CY347]